MPPHRYAYGGARHGEQGDLKRAERYVHVRYGPREKENPGHVVGWRRNVERGGRIHPEPHRALTIVFEDRSIGPTVDADSIVCFGLTGP